MQLLIFSVSPHPPSPPPPSLTTLTSQSAAQAQASPQLSKKKKKDLSVCTRCFSSHQRVADNTKRLQSQGATVHTTQENDNSNSGSIRHFSHPKMSVLWKSSPFPASQVWYQRGSPPNPNQACSKGLFLQGGASSFLSEPGFCGDLQLQPIAEEFNSYSLPTGVIMEGPAERSTSCSLRLSITY